MDAFADDHAYLRSCREQAPVVRAPSGVPIVLHFRNIEKMVDPRTTRQLETEGLAFQGVTSGPLYDVVQRSMLFSNGQVHRNRRGGLSRTFAFKLMEGYREDVRALADRLVAGHVGHGPMDFLEDIAGEIPARIIAKLLGVPEDDIPQFRKWVYAAVRGIGFHGPEERPEIEKGARALQAYVDALLDGPASERSFITRYVQDNREEGSLTEEEIRGQIITLIIAGSDTTRLALCSAMHHLLRHEDQWRTFCEAPEELKKPVVQETMRYDPSVASFPRVTLEELEIDGYVIDAGSFVGVSTMSAMRDPEAYADPDHFDIHRTDHPKWHPVFGAGAHRCLGEALARVELEEVLASLATLAPNSAPAGQPPKISGLAAVRSIDQMALELR
ncbi:cytochrome P450 [Parvularcula lutaonensis]|nr:cytochrome P450 [Parvularcula lutaonensis]